MSGWAAAAQAGMELLDTGLQTGFGIWSSNQQRAEAAKARQFSYDMFTNRHQLTVQDMRKAGLNPILAAGGGFSSGGAPSGAAASLPPVKPTTGAKDYLRQVAELDVMEQQAAKLKAEGYKTDIDAANSIKLGKIMDEQLWSSKAEAERARQAEKFFQTDAGKWVRLLGIIGKEANPFAGAASSARGALK